METLHLSGGGLNKFPIFEHTICTPWNIHLSGFDCRHHILLSEWQNPYVHRRECSNLWCTGSGRDFKDRSCPTFWGKHPFFTCSLRHGRGIIRYYKKPRHAFLHGGCYEFNKPCRFWDNHRLCGELFFRSHFGHRNCYCCTYALESHYNNIGIEEICELPILLF